MADTPKPTLEEGVTGPRVPAGFSGIRPWVMSYKPIVGVLLVGGGVYFFTHPLTMHSTAQAGTISGKVSAVNAGDIVAQPRVTLAPGPPVHRPAPPATQVAQSDVGLGSARNVQSAPSTPVAAVTVADPAPVAPAAPPAPASPATESPAHVAAREREAADRAALTAPLPAAATIANAGDRSKDPSANYVAPPSGTFLLRGTIIDVTLETSISSDVHVDQPGTIAGFIGRDVLDAYKRVVLIPRGSKALGHLASATLQPGQSRIGAIWDEIQLPNMSAIVLDGAVGADLTGTAGFGATIDRHTRREISSVVAYSILAAGVQLAQPQAGNGCGSNSFGCSPSVGQSIGAAVGTQIANAGTAAYNRNAQAPDVAHVVEGAQIAIVITRTLQLPPWDQNAR